MNRYLDNSSPEPTGQASLLNPNGYKTPDFSQFQSSYTAYQYPTPPSDNEDSNVPTTVLAYQTSDISPSYYNSSSIANKASSTSGSASSDDSQQAVISTSRYKRRSRTTFTKSQLDVLEQTFQKAQYPEIKVVDDLSTMLNLSTERISIWFQNRRARFKKARKLHAQENGLAAGLNETTKTFKPYTTPISYELSHQTAYLPAAVSSYYTTSPPQADSTHLYQSTPTTTYSSTFYPPSHLIDQSNYYYNHHSSYVPATSNYMYQC